MRLTRTIPILRMFDVELTKRFYVDYLGFTLEWQDGDGSGPTYMHLTRDGMALDLSSHHGDGTPGAVVLIVVEDAAALEAELHAKDYPFMNPGLGEHGAGRELTVLDPASNQIRFFEPGGA
jgi:catechol 2,3-dioxygenase-like lactoylglutathione lyase family enzyme